RCCVPASRPIAFARRKPAESWGASTLRFLLFNRGAGDRRELQGFFGTFRQLHLCSLALERLAKFRIVRGAGFDVLPREYHILGRHDPSHPDVSVLVGG